MTKTYKINLQTDYQKIAIATLKKVFSRTVLPKILTNVFDENLSKIIKKYAQIDVFLPKNAQNFAKTVHLQCYDIGLYFETTTKNCSKKILMMTDFSSFKKFDFQNLTLKIFDGNGLFASDFITNIFDDMLFADENTFQQKKKAVLNEYKKINRKKLLV